MTRPRADAARDGERPRQGSGRPGIALALGGGAALGWAHIGVLGVLRRAEVPIAAAAGTSIGALAAVCLAADRLDALEEIARRATRRRVLAYLDPHFRRGAWLGGRRIARELGRHLGACRFEELAIPAGVVASDLDSADEVRVTAGPVIPAVSASMALPGLFAPVAIGGRRLIDGGMTAILPVGLARALAPGRPVVAIDLLGDAGGHGRWHGPPPPLSALGTVRASASVMFRTIQRQGLRLEPADLVIPLAREGFGTGDFHRAAELIALGRAAAEAALPRIVRLATCV